MPLTADAAAQQVQDRLRSLHRLLYDIEGERARNEQCIDGILRADKSGDASSPPSSEDSSGSYQQMQLKSLYKAGLAAAEHEERVLRAALSRIYEIRAIRNERRIQARHAGNKETIGCGALMKMLLSAAQTLPLHVGRPGERAPPLCGAIPADPAYVARSGDTVAALVRVSDKEENWILAEVVGWLAAQGKYEVDDIDEEQKNRHILSKRRVVPLPLMRANPQTDEHALFPKGAVVMALYPQTTCFYKAIVNRLPSVAADSYEVLFEDPSYADGYSPPESVSQRYVIAIKEGKGRTT